MTIGESKKQISAKKQNNLMPVNILQTSKYIVMIFTHIAVMISDDWLKRKS